MVAVAAKAAAVVAPKAAAGTTWAKAAAKGAAGTTKAGTTNGTTMAAPHGIIREHHGIINVGATARKAGARRAVLPQVPAVRRPASGKLMLLSRVLAPPHAFRA